LIPSTEGRIPSTEGRIFDFDFDIHSLINDSTFEIGFVLGLFWVCFGFVLGLYWVCFSHLHQVSYFRNPLLKLGLRSFGLFGNWVCFA